MSEITLFRIRTVLLIVQLRYGGYFGQKETPYAATLSEAELTMARIAFHIQVTNSTFNYRCVLIDLNYIILQL